MMLECELQASITITLYIWPKKVDNIFAYIVLRNFAVYARFSSNAERNAEHI